MMVSTFLKVSVMMTVIRWRWQRHWNWAMSEGLNGWEMPHRTEALIKYLSWTHKKGDYTSIVIIHNILDFVTIHLRIPRQQNDMGTQANSLGQDGPQNQHEIYGMLQEHLLETLSTRRIVLQSGYCSQSLKVSPFVWLNTTIVVVIVKGSQQMRSRVSWWFVNKRN